MSHDQNNDAPFSDIAKGTVESLKAIKNLFQWLLILIALLFAVTGHFYFASKSWVQNRINKIEQRIGK